MTQAPSDHPKDIASVDAGSKEKTIPPAKAMMMIVMTFVIAITITSMVASLLVRWRGGDWNTLSNVGQFWAGHIGNLALLFLAWSLYRQQHEFNRQQRAVMRQIQVSTEQCEIMNKQLQIMQRGYDQGNLLFLMEHFKELSGELEFTVNIYEDERVISIRSVAGIRTYLEWQQNDPDALGVFVKDFRLLKDYASAIEDMEAALSGDSVGPARTVRNLCDFLYPPILRAFYKQAADERQRSEQEVERMPIADGLKPRLRALLDAGWRIEWKEMSGPRYLVFVINDALPGTPTHSSDEPGSPSWDQAVRDVLNAIRNDPKVASS